MQTITEILKVLVFSITSYITLFLISKILGKKQISQLSFADYVVGITIGSIGAEMATDTVNPFYHYLIAMGIFLLFNLGFSTLNRKGKIMKKIFSGRPLIIIENGIINYSELKKSKLSVEELLGMARDKNYFDINQIAFGIFETSGKLSILPKAVEKPIQCKDLNLVPAEPALTDYLIVDGSISEKALLRSNRNTEWLLNGLGITDEKDVTKILLASYDEENQVFNVHYKLPK